MSLITYVTRIHLADHVLEDAVEAELERHQVRRPLLVTDRAPHSQSCRRLFGAAPGLVPSQVFRLSAAMASEIECEAAAARFRAEECDALIALGGSAAIDLAKAVAVCVSHDGPLHRLADGEGGFARIRDRLPPLIAVPAPAGGGSEVGPSAVIARAEGGAMTLVSPYLIPKAAICDPTLTLDVAPEETAAAGLDALVHCLEAYLAAAYNPPADAIALDGVRRVSSSLERAMARGGDLDARRELMAGALNGGLARQKGLGAVHALSHALAANDRRLEHGALIAALTPHALRFNAPAVAERYAAVAAAIGLTPHSDLPVAFAALAARLRLPTRLGDLGVREEEARRAAAQAERDPASRTNPRRASAGDYIDLALLAL